MEKPSSVISIFQANDMSEAWSTAGRRTPRSGPPSISSTARGRPRARKAAPSSSSNSKTEEKERLEESKKAKVKSQKERQNMKVVLVANVMNEDVVGDPGDVKDIREEIAKKMIEDGLALKYVEPEDNPVERAVNDNRETATHPAQKK